MQTIAEVTERLTGLGYIDDFRAEADGLRAVKDGRLHRPEDLEIDELHRFEGPSDPAEEAIVFALRGTSTGVRGTFIAAYGPKTPAPDARMTRLLLERGADHRKDFLKEAGEGA